MNEPKIDIIGTLLIAALLISLAYGGYLSYKSIDWTVLKRLEAEPLILPTPVPSNPQETATPSAKNATK